MPPKSKNKIPKAISSHPSIAPLYKEWVAKEAELDPVRRLNRNHKNFAKKLDAQKQAEAAKIALDLAIAQLNAPNDSLPQNNKNVESSSQRPCDEAGLGSAGTQVDGENDIDMSSTSGGDDDAEDQPCNAFSETLRNGSAAVRSQEGIKDVVQASPIHDGGGQGDKLERERQDFKDSHMASNDEGEDSHNFSRNMSPSAPPSPEGVDEEMQSVSSRLTSPPMSPAATLASKPLPDVDMNPIQPFQDGIGDETMLHARNGGQSSAHPIQAVAVDPIIFDEGAIHPAGSSSGINYDIGIDAHGGTINPKFLNNMNFMQLFGGPDQGGAPVVVPSHAPSEAQVLPVLPPPIIQTPPVALPPFTPSIVQTPPAPPSSTPPIDLTTTANHVHGTASESPPITEDPVAIEAYRLPDPRPDLDLNYPWETLVALRDVRAETYSSPAESIRARKLYQKHAKSISPNNVHVENELLRSIPKDVTSLYNWVGKCNYEHLCSDDIIILQARGRAAIEAYVEDLAAAAAKKPSRVQIKKEQVKLRPSWVRTLALRYACYLPEAATTSRSVSLEFLRDTHGQVKCPNHHKQRAKDSAKRDAIIPNGHKRAGFIDLAGVGQPHYDQKSSAKLDERHLHCGCSKNDALLEWYLFKSTIARSTNPRFAHLEFHWEPDTIIPTYVRAFWVASFRQLTGLDGDSPDLYTGVAGWGLRGVWASERQIAEIKLNRFRHALSECLNDEHGVNVYPSLHEFLDDREEPAVGSYDVY